MPSAGSWKPLLPKQKGRTAGTVLDYETLSDLYNAGAPSLKSINYCHSVISTMSATNPTDAQKAGALHAYGECVGFIHGWRTIPQAYKTITNAEIDEILTLLDAPYYGTPTSWKFITDPLNELPKLTQVIGELNAKYGFMNQEIEDFKKN